MWLGGRVLLSIYEALGSILSTRWENKGIDEK
jgi:hypothetical protein